MRCPFCEDKSTSVIDTRTVENGTVIRRRRYCESCKKKFTTYERVDHVLRVHKKDGTYEAYDRAKIEKGISMACYKCRVSEVKIRNIVDNIERDVFNEGVIDIESSFIGERVMLALKELDKVAYVRFASIYREFRDLESFYSELNSLNK